MKMTDLKKTENPSSPQSNTDAMIIMEPQAMKVGKLVEKGTKQLEEMTSVYQVLQNYENGLMQLNKQQVALDKKTAELMASNLVLAVEMKSLSVSINNTFKVGADQFYKDTTKALDGKVIRITKDLDTIFQNYEARVNNRGFWEVAIAGLIFIDVLINIAPYVKQFLK